MTESDLRNTMGANLKRYRKNKGLSQGQLAEILDISPNFISELETGKRWLSSDTLVSMAEALSIEAYELLMPKDIPTEEITAFIQNYTKKASAAISEAVIKSLCDLNKQFT